LITDMKIDDDTNLIDSLARVMSYFKNIG